MPDQKVTTSTRSWKTEVEIARRADEVYVSNTGDEPRGVLPNRKPPRYVFTNRVFVEGEPYAE